MVDDLPELNKRVKELVTLFAAGNETKFLSLLNNGEPDDRKIKQQTFNRLFRIDKRTNKFPKIPDDITTAILTKIEEVGKVWLLTGAGDSPQVKLTATKNDNQKTVDIHTGESDPVLALQDFREKYYQQLEENNKLLKFQVTELKQLTEQVTKDLDDVSGTQLTILSMGQALQDVVLQNLFPDSHADLRKNVHNRGVVIQRALNRKGNTPKNGR